MTRRIDRDYRWLMRARLGKYKGLYVAIYYKKVIASGKNAGVVFRAGMKVVGPDDSPPLIAYVPTDDALMV